MNFSRTRVAKTRRARAAMASAVAVFAMLTIVAATATAEYAPGSTANSRFVAPSSAPTDQAQNAPKSQIIDGRISDSHSFGGDGIRVRGVVSADSARSLVKLQVRSAGSRRWLDVRSIRASANRKFTLVWRGGKPGRYMVRLIVSANGKRGVDHLGLAYVFRRSFASWYGPGFYGNRTACGGTLTASVVGVAHKTLPCGTRVTFHLHGRTVTARVIDRGPYVGGRDWDLTPALKRRLRFGSTGVVNTTR